MSAGIKDDDTGQTQGLLRSMLLPVSLFGISMIAGTGGYFLYLPTLPTYATVPAYQLAIEGFFRSLGFLVLSMGTLEPVETVPLVLITIGRTFGLLFSFYAALTGISLLFAERLLPLRIKMWAWLDRFSGLDNSGHVLVCGIGDDGYALAAEALNDGRNVVVIDTHPNDRTADLKSKGALLIKGDASHAELLTNRAQIRYAKDIFVTTGDDETNGSIVEAIDQQVTRVKPDHACNVTARIEDQRLRQALHQETTGTHGLYVRTYDVPEATARELLTRAAVDNVKTLDERVHVWIVGWTPLSKALVEQLLHLMHYPAGIDRQVTIIAADPASVERDVADIAPGVDPDWWDDTEMRELVATVFPPLDIQPLPQTDSELLSDRLALYDTVDEGDRLTIFADDTDSQRLRGLLSTWVPKLDDLTRRNGLDTKLYYRHSPQSTWQPRTSIVTAESYQRFGSGCSIRAVRGEQRDYVARRLSLVYHLLYADALSGALPEPAALPIELDGDVDAVMSWIDSLPADQVDHYATAVWQSLPEYQRESNRHAADHAAVKQRMWQLLTEQTDEETRSIIRLLAKTEHRRWCVEKILTGWEPLPDAEMERWETESGEEQLRRQRYHPDIRSVASLQAEMGGEWDKDVSQVLALVEYPRVVGHPTSDG